MYGGMEIGLGVFLAYALRRNEWRGPALMVIACSIGSLALTRITATAIEGARPIMYGLAAAEGSVAFMAITALSRTDRQESLPEPVSPEHRVA